MNWKGASMQFLTFAVAPLVGALGVVGGVRAAVVGAMEPRRFLLWTTTIFLLTRVGTHLVVFHLFRYSGTSDLHDFWVPTARAVLDGRDPAPYADGLSGPLFPYVLAAGLAWSGGRYLPGIDLPFVVADALSLVLLWRIARRHLPETTARRIVLALALSPLLWLGVTVFTQDEALFAFFLLWTLDLSERGRVLGAAAVAAFATLCTKALFPLWALPVLIAGSGGLRGAMRRVAAAAAFTAAGIGVALLAGWNLAGRLRESRNTFGSSTWRLFVPDGTLTPTAFHVGLAATSTVAVLAAVAASRPRDGESAPDAAARGVVAVQAAFFVACPYTIPLHLVHGLPFLAWQVVREGASSRRTTVAAGVLLAGFAAWQIPSFSVEAAWWSEMPILLAAFAAFWAWTGSRAVVSPWQPAGPTPEGTG